MAKAKHTRKAMRRNLRDLIDDPRNSISEENILGITSADYENTLKHLSRYRFWQPAPKGIRPLWAHQIAAINLSAAYLAADKKLPAEGNALEAALIKIPTGAGKSGVVAILSRCLPHVRRVLVLTPRTALAEQLRQDIRWRFWQHLGFEAIEDSTFISGADDAGAKLEATSVIELLPSTAKAVIAAAADDRSVIVGTFQALEQMYRGTSDKPVSADDAPTQESAALDALKTYDLVIVDEGHYEPAPAWSRAVRDFGLPTILLSATPYRNDYKSFRVRGRFVFNYSFDEAIEDKTLRWPVFLASKSGPVRRSKDDIKRFVDLLADKLPDLLKKARAYTTSPKVIVRADDFKKLVLLQAAIRKSFKENPILIHHQIRSPDLAMRRFKSVAQAREAPDWINACFWLHASKLLEGIDDPSFVAVAIYDRFTNARQLVQQVGRALRTTDKTRSALQEAWVLSVPENQELLRASWNRYLDFEKYAAKDPQHLVQAEGALPDKLLASMPDVQYLNGEFRPRFAAGQAQAAQDFRIPASAAVFEVSESLDLSVVAKQVEEALLAEDRFKPLRIAGLPSNTLAFAYYGWRSSPYLSLQFFPEWTLGVCILVQVDRLLLVQDTGGIVLAEDVFGMHRIDRQALARLMPQNGSDGQVRISRIATFSLDVSERAIRSMALRTRSLGDTFGDLLDPVLVPTTAFGFVSGRGRYLGLTRGRISDSYAEPLPLLEFCEWAKDRASELNDKQRTQNPVFDRYAAIRDRLTAVQAIPVSILLDFDDTFTDYLMTPDANAGSKQFRDVKYDDLCSDVDEDGGFEISLDDKVYACVITFNEETQRYNVTSEALDAVLTARATDGDRTAVPITTHMNREQAFRIIVRERGVIYAHRKFFVPNTDYVRPDGSVPLLASVYEIPALNVISTEKGENLYPTRRARWRQESLFGLVKAVCAAPVAQPQWGRLYRDLRSFDTIVCDDDGEEIGDFLAIDEAGKRVAIIHAKRAKTPHQMSVGALQEVGRQVLASLAFCSAVAREPKIKPGRWATNVNANGTALNLSRIFRNTKERSVASIETLAATALADRSWKREIWILAGKLMSREAVESAVRNDDSNRARQFLMYLESLITGCARANSDLRIYCNE